MGRNAVAKVAARKRYARYLGRLQRNVGVRVSVPPCITLGLFELYGIERSARALVRDAQRDWQFENWWERM